MLSSQTQQALLEQWPLALGWILYAAIHSLLASNSCKGWLKWRAPHFVANYRLVYNGLALLLLLPLAWLSISLPGPVLWAWTGPMAWLMNGIAAAALISFFRQGNSYDLREFLGLSPAHQARPTRLVISQWHRFVRHPWYSLGLVLIWTRDMSASTLVSALAITLYFWIGSRFEEAKLCAEFGQRYRDYQSQVSRLVPLPGRILSKAEAQRLAA